MKGVSSLPLLAESATEFDRRVIAADRADPNRLLMGENNGETQFPALCLHHWIFRRDRDFADSSLEGSGFEPPGPARMRHFRLPPLSFA